MPRNKKSRIRTPPVTAVLNAAELSSGFLAFPSGECQHKRLQALRPRLTPGLPKFSVLRDVPGCWYYPTQSGMQKVSFGGGALIFPPGHPALALALFYQICLVHASVQMDTKTEFAPVFIQNQPFLVEIAQ